MNPSSETRITAVLGPTNTGKTHHAIERMLAHKTGVIGFPLRLLARENYDKVVARKGRNAVALVTGEEKIIPPKARYYLCTVEAMPVEETFEFLGVDEIQLCADPERGHVFTDRLLRARGVHETMFMGSDTMRPVMAALVPGIKFESRERLSRLTYTGPKKLVRLPKRTAVVAFSIEDVYAMAEIIRKHRGGTAVVLGALSPRTRNAQVDMYQSGEVDFLVATDAIGMGLNMDIHHVALAATRKFDGTRARELSKAELAQIAGRAGRYMKDGTFGVTGRQGPLDSDIVTAIENHIFKTIQEIYWRNHRLDFHSPLALLKSLELPSGHPMLVRGRPSDDYLTLQALMNKEEIGKLATNPERVRLLWDVCQVPDFRKTLSDAHQALMGEIYVRLCAGPLDEEWVAGQVRRQDNVQGDADTLMARIAHVRTWTYISFKAGWMRRAEEWQAEARAIEDRLSDALHEALVNRFVDRRSAALMRDNDEGKALLAGVRANGEVVVEGHLIGQLQGFRFIPDETAKGADYKAVMAAARQTLRSEIEARLKKMLNAPATQFKLADDGRILYQPLPNNPLPGQPVARLRKGKTPLSPDVEMEESDLLTGQDKSAVKEFLNGWLKTHVQTVLGTLAALENIDDLPGPARGICFQLYEAMGIVPRENLEDLIASLDQPMRQALRAKQVRLGPILVFLPALNKPAAVRLRGLLWAIWNDKSLPAGVPADGVVSIKIDPNIADRKFYQAIGYPVYGTRAIRIDMLDRVISAVYDQAKEGKFRAEHKMAEWLGSPIEDLYAVLEAMGHRKIEAPKVPEAPSLETPSADAAPAPEAQTVVQESATLTAEQPAAKDTEAAPEPATETEPAVPSKSPEVKPELALFRLKKGKAFEKPKFHERNQERKEFQPRNESESRKERSPQPARKDFRDDKKPRGERKFEKKFDNKRYDKRQEEPRVMQANVKSKPEDSPFAILQQLKVKRDAAG